MAETSFGAHALGLVLVLFLIWAVYGAMRRIIRRVTPQRQLGRPRRPSRLCSNHPCPSRPARHEPRRFAEDQQRPNRCHNSFNRGRPRPEGQPLLRTRITMSVGAF